MSLHSNHKRCAYSSILYIYYVFLPGGIKIIQYQCTYISPCEDDPRDSVAKVLSRKIVLVIYACYPLFSNHTVWECRFVWKQYRLFQVAFPLRKNEKPNWPVKFTVLSIRSSHMIDQFICKCTFWCTFIIQYCTYMSVIYSYIYMIAYGTTQNIDYYNHCI